MKIIGKRNLTINGVKSHVIEIPRKQVKVKCPECENHTSNVHDYRKQNIKHTKLFGYNTYIVYHKRRYNCPRCNKSFYEPNNVTAKHGKISLNLKLSILDYLKKKMSIKDIAECLNISSSTVIRALKSIDYKPASGLPEVMCIDEFKSTKSLGNYSFIIANPMKSKIVDILPVLVKNNVIR